jgi:acyl-coenzyme A thioesterase PaaI-like protein
VKAEKIKRLFSFYGPYLGAGIKVEHIDSNWRYCRVSMRLRWYNTNAVSVHFGGSLYSMVDPHYMLLVMKSLGKEYTVWDKSASIEFIRPGKGYVYAEFNVTDQMLEDIRENTQNGEKYCPTFSVDIKSEDGKTICRVEKTLYIRKAKQEGVRI